MKNRILALAVSTALTGAASAGGLCVVDKGVAKAQIVVASAAHEGEQFAARELQTWIGEITGVFVPVRSPAWAESGKPTVYVGSEFAKKRFASDFKAIGTTDGFAVREGVVDGVGCVFAFGSTPKGTLHAAYALLERNSDIIWPRPDPRLGAVFSVGETFSVTNADFIEVPRTKVRDWQWNYAGRRGAQKESLWGARNRLNRCGTSDGPLASSYVGGGKGHGIQKYANPAKNFSLHPEWFPEIGGKRTMEGGQLCMTADGLAEEIYVNVTNDLAMTFPGVPPRRMKVDFYNLTCADNHAVCECRQCVAAFLCENGATIGIDDPAFRSSQYYALLNRVARLLAKSHPRVVLGSYAYALTRHAPPFRLEPKVSVELCLTGYDERASLDDKKRNASCRRWTEEWSDKCRDLWIRTYCGWSGRNYRAIEYGYAESGRFAAGLKHPVTQYSAEIQMDEEVKGRYGAEIWDTSGMSYWVISRLWWDPFQDVDALRRMYVERTYREATPAMQKYFDLFRDAYFIDRMPASYRITGTAFMTRHYLYETGVGQKLLALLDEASAAARHPVSREIVRRQRMRLKANLDRAAALPDSRLAVRPLSAGWDAADETRPFVEAAGIYGTSCDKYGGKAEVKTTAKALYDAEALYLRFTCEAPDAPTLYGAAGTGDPEEQPICDDTVEIFLCRPDTGEFWQWIMDPGAKDGQDIVFDAKGDDAKWKGNWTRDVTRTDAAWCVTLRVPFADMGFVAPPSELRFNALRARVPPYAAGEKRPRHIRSSWTGGGVHDSGGFGLLNFIK